MNPIAPETQWLIVTTALCVVILVLGCITAMLFRRQARMREEKRLSDSRYRTVIEQAGDAIFLVDAETGRLVEANSSLRRKLGYGADEILGLRLEDILVEQPVGLDTAAFARMANTR